ncbi:GntR family transcriptional regulator [bacteria symbiont BFo1 of Frankliniella occidentalis]|jgi:DNA-binding FadR family transcriptional regulator|uniref:FadR/GntR family transcriptional regulator n=1 Tax=Erwinia aphidicola TaxID=68334 RepID=A0ABU8DD04_ERWAP|nr:MULTISPECIES: FadR/GntR family transcriptional regulator [Erwinia]KMV68316.1 GntR family transcriptional regulator [bacteria symbiont BFo1 of Frankliniella occidentalis]PIJ55359.1 GntR family transcriptional regulator [Erwinia sp. OLMDLW33]KYP83094.1 GntR family transcriptional regulator [bacteria symbiont BFo1 of Frankliniella occidentalis]KYP87935.1 GntR family transcriptional regulator [bacteria symbiont BFo1 of Frankliniella occidentalis]MBD1377772.1 FadR family transcriptional regulato
MDLPTLKVERLYRQISNLLINCIKQGQFPAGAILPPERELAKQLGVSRSSIREALIALEITGWVEIRTGNGVYVMNPLPQSESAPAEEEFSLKALIQARQVYEAMTAELAARNGSDDQRAELQEITQDLIQLHVNDDKFLREDKRFHLLIAEMTGNEVLRDMMEYLWNKRKSSRFVRLESHYAESDFPREMNQDHADIAAAIIARDAPQARACMERHLQHVYDRLFIE